MVLVPGRLVLLVLAGHCWCWLVLLLVLLLDGTSTDRTIHAVPCGKEKSYHRSQKLCGKQLDRADGRHHRPGWRLKFQVVELKFGSRLDIANLLSLARGREVALRVLLWLPAATARQKAV